ncbi:hypothetical protein ACPPVS_12405 [Cellulomonas sp. McL0617]|uniref:hypothetical protein n=1 Tax=Cellulomonas sp. McL0617 TaxID=3415675 RepID=UPI003CEE7D7C
MFVSTKKMAAVAAAAVAIGLSVAAGAAASDGHPDQAAAASKSAEARPDRADRPTKDDGPAESDGADLLTQPAAVSALAAALGVSQDAARAALVELVAQSEAGGGLTPSSAAFGAVAEGLGVSPAELVAGIDAMKSVG